MADVLLIADDLTGALDSAVAFAERGMRVVAALGVDHLPRALTQNAHVVAVSTGSRELAPEAARAVMTAARDAAAGFSGILFKKVDSRLKGPVAAELDVVSTMKPGPVLACPAIPRLGRYVVDGAVTGAGVDAPIDVRSAIGRAATVPDATADADIDAALPDTLGQTLFVGAAGLAEALARRLAPAPPERRAARVAMPTVWGIGSRDAVTLGQLGVLRHHTIIKAPNGEVPETDPAAMTILQLVPGRQAVSAHQAGDRFAEGVSRLTRNGTPSSLFACGGETASAVLARLDVTLLEIVGEVLPGVPVSRALDGIPGLDVITKSGGFGAEDTLQHLADLTEAAGRSQSYPAKDPAAIG